MIFDWTVKSEGKDARTIQYPNEQLKEIETAQCQELTCFYVCTRQGCKNLPVMGVVDDTHHQCFGYRKYRI